MFLTEKQFEDTQQQKFKLSILVKIRSDLKRKICDSFTYSSNMFLNDIKYRSDFVDVECHVLLLLIIIFFLTCTIK